MCNINNNNYGIVVKIILLYIEHSWIVTLKGLSNENTSVNITHVYKSEMKHLLQLIGTNDNH